MLLPNWQAVLRHAWSVRLLAIAALLSGVEAVLPFLQDFLPISPGTFALLSLAVSIGALIARIVSQKDIPHG